MARISATSGKNNATNIKNETANKANTALRVGTSLEDIWDSLSHKDTTDSIETSKEPSSVVLQAGDIDGNDLILPSPLPKTLFVQAENVLSSESILFPNDINQEGTYVQIQLRSCYGNTLKIKDLRSGNNYYVSENFGLPITQVGTREFTVQLPNTSDVVVIAMTYNDGCWAVNASIYKTPTVSP